MADTPHKFKVIISGGSLSGLVLASALEKAGVDFVVLEKRDIAPHLGNSLATLPCTTKVMAQLGIEKSFLAPAIPLMSREHYDEKGRMFSRSDETAIVAEKTKRPMVILERHHYLNTLYGSITDKSKVLARTGVASFVEHDHGVTVTTDKGQTIEGSILVGADGIHSAVRSLMADEIAKENPAVAKNLIEGFKTKYRILWGASKNYFKDDPDRQLVPDGVTQTVYYREVGGLAVCGLEGFVFWCMYLKEDEPSTTPNSPRFTDADCEAEIAKHGHLKLGAGYTYNDLWESRVSTSMVPMEEGVITAPWNNGGRVVLLGDAVHKATANLGMGGNAAVDGACYLVNELLPLLHRDSPEGGLPTTEEIVGAFRRYEAKQRPRANFVVTASGYAVRLETMDAWWLRIVMHVIPWVPTWIRARLFLDFDSSAPQLDFLPNPDETKS